METKRVNFNLSIELGGAQTLGGDNSFKYHRSSGEMTFWQSKIFDQNFFDFIFWRRR